jgi:GNAT superfamily N-acetyltransferase
LAAQAEFNVEIRPIRPGDTLTGLSLGDAAFAALKTFVQRHAQTYERQSLARTYGAFDRANDDKLLGYVTLLCGEVVIQEGDEALVAEEEMQYPYRHYPAVKIARLAVDRRFRGLGIGEALVNLALGIAQQFICPNVGCRFVMVDSKQQSVGFYDRSGFTLLDTPENRHRDEPVMFVDLSKLD